MGSGYRKLGLPREEELSGRGVSWCATCDGFFFREQHIAVVGGGDSAVEEATFLTRFGSKVSLIVRRDELRASKIMQERAFADPKLEIIWNSAVETINGADRLESVTLKDTVTGETRDLPATGLFIAIGHDPRSELLHRPGRPRRQRLRARRAPLDRAPTCPASSRPATWSTTTTARRSPPPAPAAPPPSTPSATSPSWPTSPRPRRGAGRADAEAGRRDASQTAGA